MMAQVKDREMVRLPVVQDESIVQLWAVQAQLGAVQAQPSHLLGVLNCEKSLQQ